MKDWQGLISRKLACFGMGVCFCLVGCDDGTSKSAETNAISTEHLEQRRINPQDECPKLVQKRVDRTVMSRQEQIVGNFCEYFIYPKIGEMVNVTVSDARMKPYLEIPYYHDFANGRYEVVTGGRHVIRLEYDSLDRKPDVMNYVLEVEIAPKK